MVLKLPEEMTITGAASLKAAFEAALAVREDVQLDAAAVSAADLVGLQILVAAQRSAARAGLALAFAEGGRSQAIDVAAASLGFRKPIGEEPGWLWEEAACA